MKNEFSDRIGETKREALWGMRATGFYTVSYAACVIYLSRCELRFYGHYAYC